MGMMFVIHVPRSMAVPSAIRKASVIPSRRWRCFCVFVDSSSMESWVLSPSSARLMAISGMSMSGIMLLLGFFWLECGVYESVLSWA